MPLANHPVDRRRSAIAIRYMNESLIHRIVMPPVPAGGERFTWFKYRSGEAFRTVNSLVGRTGQVQDIEFGYDEVEGRTKDYGLQTPVPQKDIDNAPAGSGDILDQKTEMVTQWVELDREKRVADTVFDINNYATSNRLTLSGAGQFSNYTLDTDTPANESNPIGVIETAKRTMLARPNLCIMGEDTWSILRQHPKLISAQHGNEGRYGLMTEEFFQEMFGMQLVIGAARLDATREGQTPNPARLWDNDIALLRIDPTANIQSGMTWGMSPEWGARRVYRWFDQDIGLDGGQIVRVGEHCTEIVAAPDYGYIIKAAH